MYVFYRFYSKNLVLKIFHNKIVKTRSKTADTTIRTKKDISFNITKLSFKSGIKYSEICSLYLPISMPVVIQKTKEHIQIKINNLDFMSSS